MFLGLSLKHLGIEDGAEGFIHLIIQTSLFTRADPVDLTAVKCPLTDSHKGMLVTTALHKAEQAREE